MGGHLIRWVLRKTPVERGARCGIARSDGSRDRRVRASFLGSSMAARTGLDAWRDARAGPAHGRLGASSCWTRERVVLYELPSGAQPRLLEPARGEPDSAR